MPKFHYTDPEKFFRDKNNITVDEIKRLLCAMEHCISSCYYNECFSKAMYELCPEASDTVREYLREWSEREIKAQNLRRVNQQDFERYQEFASSVSCLLAEGSEFMTKEQLYDAIKNEFNKVILKQEKDHD